MKLDLFDAIVGLFVLMFVIFAVVEGYTWIVRKIRSRSYLRSLGKDAQELPIPNAGFSLRRGQRSSAARRHIARDEELRLQTHLGWGQRRHPPPDRE